MLWPDISQGNRYPVDFGKALRESCALVRHYLLLPGYHRREAERKPETPGIWRAPSQSRTGTERTASRVTEPPRGNFARKSVAPLSGPLLRKRE